MQKEMILSDIPVHREQAPDQSVFFNPDDPGQLKDILIAQWERKGNSEQKKVIKHDDLATRTIKFGSKFQSVILEATKIR